MSEVQKRMEGLYNTIATWLHGYGLWFEPSSAGDDIPTILFLLLWIYSWAVIMSPLLAVMMLIRYLRNR